MLARCPQGQTICGDACIAADDTCAVLTVVQRTQTAPSNTAPQLTLVGPAAVTLAFGDVYAVCAAGAIPDQSLMGCP